MGDEPRLPLTVAGAGVGRLLERVAGWAAPRPDLVAVALVGSWARGTARPDSDVDLVIVARDPAGYLAWTRWLDAFGTPVDVVREDWGVVRSLRVWYGDGPEVEFGLTGPAWLATDPVDPGRAEAIAGGLRVLHDPSGALERVVDAVRPEASGAARR